METENRPAACDRCDDKLMEVEPPAVGDGRRRFVDAYGECGAVSPAARRAGVHRATVYRWLAGPTFAAAVRAAGTEFLRRVQAKALAAESERRRWRAERERERHAMRCHHLALARATKREKKLRG